MINTFFNSLMYIMPVLAVIVFIALFFVKAGYGIFHTKSWGLSLPNKVGWVIMECLGDNGMSRIYPYGGNVADRAIFHDVRSCRFLHPFRDTLFPEGICFSATDEREKQDACQHNAYGSRF